MRRVYVCPDCGSDEMWQSGEYDEGEAILICNQCGNRSYEGELDKIYEEDDGHFDDPEWEHIVDEHSGLGETFPIDDSEDE